MLSSLQMVTKKRVTMNFKCSAHTVLFEGCPKKFKTLMNNKSHAHRKNTLQIVMVKRKHHFFSARD